MGTLRFFSTVIRGASGDQWGGGCEWITVDDRSSEWWVKLDIAVDDTGEKEG